MKTHTTNYKNTFIQVAEDCPASQAEIPPIKGDKKSIANLEFEILSQNPYKFTSDDVIFTVYAQRNDLSEAELDSARATFFSKGQPCMRSSALTKRYGFGIHNDAEGKIALYGMDTKEYEQFSTDKNIAQVKAMRSKRA